MAGDRWIFTKSQLVDTPSRKCGIDSDKELMYRQQAANLIQDMGQRLQVAQLCINTAIVYMHRFYMFHTFQRFHRNQIAAASIFLAAKVEEQPRKLEHVIKVMHICLHRDGTTLDTKSNEYLDMAQELVINENILLQTLGFEITVDHPHTTVVKTCQLVRAPKDLAQTSYFLATNSLHLTTMSLQYKPTQVACVCIHLACKWASWEIPRSSEGKDWYWYVDKSVTMELLEELTQDFLNILDKCPSKLKKKIMAPKSAKDGGKEEFEAAEKRPKMESSAAGSSSSSQPTGGAKPSTHHHHHHHHHHTPTNHDRKTDKHNDISNIKLEPSQTPSAAKQSEMSTSAGQPATPNVSSSKGHLTGQSSGKDTTKKSETGSTTITTTYKEYKERKERERLEALAKSSSQEIDSKPIKSEPGTPNLPAKTESQSSTPKIHIKLEPGTNRNDNSGKYSSKDSHSRHLTTGQVKPEGGIQIKQEPGVHIKTEPGTHISTEVISSKKSHKHSAELVRGSETKIHIKKEPPSSQEIKTEAPSPLKLKIKTSHIPKDQLHSDKHSNSGLLKSEQTPHGIKLSKESSGKEKSRSHGEGHRDRSHKSSKHHDKNVSGSSSFSGTNGKSDLKLHISMSALQQHHRSHKNVDGKSSDGHSKSRDKHSHSSSHSKQDQGAKKGSQSQERHAPWTLSELTSSASTSTSSVASPATGSKKRPLSPNTGMANDLQSVQKNKISKTDSNSLRRNSSNLSVVSMDLCSDSGSVTAGEISVYGMPDPMMGMEANGRHSGSAYMGNQMPVKSQMPIKSQIEPYLQNLQRAIEIQKGQLMAQPEPPPPPPLSPPPPPPPPPSQPIVSGDMSYSSEPSLFDIDFFDHVPPLPDDQPPRPPTPPLEPKLRPNPPF